MIVFDPSLNDVYAGHNSINIIISEYVVGFSHIDQMLAVLRIK